MDYTTIQRFKSELHATLNADDTIIGTLITAASRAIDRRVTGAIEPETSDYFKQETIVDEITRGMLGSSLRIIVYPRKPVISSVSKMEYRIAPTDSWVLIDPRVIVPDGPRVEAWMETQRVVQTRITVTIPAHVFVRISYQGGFSLTPDAMPDDLKEVATMLAIRYYREAEGGLQDSIGVAELAQLIYTKAWPTRALDLLRPYTRRVAWRGYS